MAGHSTPSTAYATGTISIYQSLQSDHESDSDEPYVVTVQGGMGGGGGRVPMFRSEVWERGRVNGTAGTPPKVRQAYQDTPSIDNNTIEPVLAYQPLSSTQPIANHKHLYITNQILRKRLHTPHPSFKQTPNHRPLPKMYKIDAISSVKSGGLPGHSEAIYTLSLIRHRMSITMIQPGLQGGYESLLSLTSFARDDHGSHIAAGYPAENPVVGGRDWLLSGSRDRTLRLWSLAGGKTRVIKVYHGGHEGSILSLFTTLIPIKEAHQPRTPPPTNKRAERDRRERLVAVSAGSDGFLCLWDIEHGGTPETSVRAHDGPILCVKGNYERVVSCSKGEQRLQAGRC
jgi:hypothetical protein